jgi:hypothetical protein
MSHKRVMIASSVRAKRWVWCSWSIRSTLQLWGETWLHCRGVKKLWEALYEADADVVFSGYEHNYERFSPQDPQGKADPEGDIRQFVVGTSGGGKLPQRRPHGKH